MKKKKNKKFRTKKCMIVAFPLLGILRTLIVLGRNLISLYLRFQKRASKAAALTNESFSGEATDLLEKKYLYVYKNIILY